MADNLQFNVTKVQSKLLTNLQTTNVTFQVKFTSGSEISLIDIDILMFRDLLEDIYKSVTSDFKEGRYCQINLTIEGMNKKWIR